MGRPGDRVLGYSDMGREEPGDEIAFIDVIIARRRTNQAEPFQPLDKTHIRVEAEHLLRRPKNGHVLNRPQQFLRRQADGLGKPVGHSDGRCRPGRKIHDQQIAVAGNIQHVTGHRMKANRLAGRFQPIQNQPCRCQGRVAGEIDFRKRREPANVEIAIVAGNEIRRLRKIVFKRDGLHYLVRQPNIERANRRRVAAENPVRKGVNLI